MTDRSSTPPTYLPTYLPTYIQPETAKLPGDYEKNLNDFERLILLRSLRPDRVTTALRGWIGRYVNDSEASC